MNLFTISEDMPPAAFADNSVPDELVLCTPFHMEDDWELVSDNTNSSCSHAEIETLIQKRIINLIDLEIMKVLATYHYINHHNLLTALNLRLHPGYHKASYLSNIRKLKKAGILLSYHLIRPADIAADQGAAPVSPLKLYCLSQSACTYVERICPDFHPLLPSSARRKLELAATGQFLIQFEAHYRGKIARINYQLATKLGNTRFLIDAMIRYQTVLAEQPSIVTLFILSVRSHKDCEKSALARLHLLSVWLSRHETECLIPLPVFLVENITMAISIYARMISMASFPGFPVYFCPDTLLMTYPPLRAVYRCETNDDGKITAVRMILDETIS